MTNENVNKTDEEIMEEVEKGFNAFIDHQRSAMSEAGKALLSLIPADFKDHGRAAFNEMLEAYRALFNATIDEVTSAVKRVRVEANEAAEEIEVEVEDVKIEE